LRKEISMDLSKFREKYTQNSLDTKDVDSNPIEQFKKWMQEAINSECPEPNAMTLATVDSEGAPHARIVLLKGITETGLIFYSNYDSAKATEMSSSNKVSLVFNWLNLHRQVRIEGLVTKTNRETSETYFQSRPRGSQIGAYVSEQSQVIKDRAYLEERLKIYESKFKGLDTIPVPENWGGFHVEANLIEFWQGRRSRLHDRLRFTKNDVSWQIDRLAP